MSRAIKRKIIVLEDSYIWTLKNNRIDTENVYIRVFKENHTNSILYIDPYCYFEIRPKTIMNVIIFALKNGWQPEVNNCDLYVGRNENGFLKLKEKTFSFDEINK